MCVCVCVSLCVCVCVYMCVHLRARCCGSQEGLQHVPVLQSQLALDDGRLVDARGCQGGAKRGAGEDGVHGGREPGARR